MGFWYTNENFDLGRKVKERKKEEARHYLFACYYNGNLSIRAAFFRAYSPYIDSCLKLFTTATFIRLQCGRCGDLFSVGCLWYRYSNRAVN